MNALHDRYAQLKVLINQKNDELRQLYETKMHLKQQIILQELQELPRDYKENLVKKLQRLKVFVEYSSVYDGRYAFVFVEQPVDSSNTPVRDPLDWQIIEYTMEKNRYVEIALSVSKVSICTFVREWLDKNCLKLQHVNYLYTMNIQESDLS